MYIYDSPKAICTFRGGVKQQSPSWVRVSGLKTRAFVTMKVVGVIIRWRQTGVKHVKSDN